jgi:hypothetical protein
VILKNFKRLLIFIAAIAIVLVAYGLLTMKEKRNPIGVTSNAIRPLSPGTDADSAHP